MASVVLATSYIHAEELVAAMSDMHICCSVCMLHLITMALKVNFVKVNWGEIYQSRQFLDLVQLVG